MISAVFAAAAVTAEGQMDIAGDDLGRGRLVNTAVDERGRMVLHREDGPRPASGVSFHELDLADAVRPTRLSVVDPVMPDKESAGARRSRWPAAVTDIIAQVRFLQPDGAWSPWQPRNILSGGDLADRTGNGIPDGVSVMRLRTEGSTLFVDDPTPCPGDSWWRAQTVSGEGRFSDTHDAPPGRAVSLRLARDTSDGQDTAEFRRDLVPPGTTLTVSGWTRYDIGDETCMGVMSRFHEFDAEGRRIGKFVLLGDDDRHQPTGSSPWRWRAMTFTTGPETVRLGVYPVRMIRATGRAWAAAWEIREEPVFSPWGEGTILFREDFSSLNGWSADTPNGVRIEPAPSAAGGGALILSPRPGSVTSVVRDQPIPLRAGILYAFRIEMENRVPDTYDRTHDAWVSCYLEFLDSEGAPIDYAKAMVFRPEPLRPVGAAMVAPHGTFAGRFVLVASHKTYADPGRITGTMMARFRRLQLEESGYDPTWTARPPLVSIPLSAPPRATRMQIRAHLLTRDPALSPSFAGYTIETAAEPMP